MHQDNSALNMTFTYPCPEPYTPINEITAPKNLLKMITISFINVRKHLFNSPNLICVTLI